MINIFRFKKRASKSEAEAARKEADRLREEVAARRRDLLQKTIEMSTGEVASDG